MLVKQASFRKLVAAFAVVLAASSLAYAAALTPSDCSSRQQPGGEGSSREIDQVLNLQGLREAIEVMMRQVRRCSGNSNLRSWPHDGGSPIPFTGGASQSDRAYCGGGQHKSHDHQHRTKTDRNERNKIERRRPHQRPAADKQRFPRNDQPDLSGPLQSADR
jgi:hypothetical protein